MRIKTLNSTYNLLANGDGTYLVSSTNKKFFPIVLKVELLSIPTVDCCLGMRFLEGPRKGDSMTTSLVREVVL